MIAMFMMVIGAILAIVGFLGLLALMTEPVYTMYMVIFKRKDDYVYYETKPGKALLQRNKKSLRSSCLFFLIVGVLLFAGGWFWKFGPRGTDSLFSKQVEAGTGQGDAAVQNHVTQYVNPNGNYVDGNGMEHSYYVIVNETTISYCKEFQGNEAEFADFIKGLDGKRDVFLVDEYAVANTYEAVKKILDDCGMNVEGEEIR